MAVRTDDEVWQRRAGCRGPESALFFAPTAPEPGPEREAREARAKQICAACGVRVECLEYALRIRDPHGIWGGMDERQRRALLDRRAND
ncbi:MAG: WhiB family transcriptional regulator [Acidimicrobiia bacterium]|nr:WhiB family transcriptional regulator [Acidimicrobiia bacterium]